MELYISELEPRESGAILVCDEDRNDIAEFYHNEHATVGQSYETALMLARKLTEPPMFERDAIARCLFNKAMSGHAQWDEMTEPHKEDWRGRADVWILDVTNLIEMSKSFRAASTITRPFYGAECPSYPDCSGGCGLGCTKNIESAKASSPVSSKDPL